MRWKSSAENKKNSAASPIDEKKLAFEELKALVVAVPAKRPVVAYQPPPKIEDQPDYYSEPTVSYD